MSSRKKKRRATRADGDLGLHPVCFGVHWDPDNDECDICDAYRACEQRSAQIRVESKRKARREAHRDESEEKNFLERLKEKTKKMYPESS